MSNKNDSELRMEATGERYISKSKEGYMDTIKIVTDYFEGLKYRTIHGYACYNKFNRAVAVANIYCVPPDDSLESLALIVAFPKKRQSSTKRILERLDKLQKCWENVGIVLSFSRGTGLFPIIIDRVWAKNRLIRIFSCDLNTYNIDKKNEKLKSLSSYHRELTK